MAQKKINIMAEARWAVKHFKPIQEWVIENYWFGIIAQSDGQYSVKIVYLPGCERAPDEGMWLVEGPFETESGCFYHILRFLEIELS